MYLRETPINSMQGYISVSIPTKKYIKAYIVNKLGAEKPKLFRGNPITNKVYDLLEHGQNQKRTEFNSRYNETLTFYISYDLYYRRGSNLNHNNIKNFNVFVEDLIKERFYQLMDDFIEVLPSFEAHLPEVRRRLGIDIEAWSDDSMRKDYYRYRKEAGKQLFYNKISGRVVPSENFSNFAF